jgi:aspartokinase/homoserine dehydrogenase 1
MSDAALAALAAHNARGGSIADAPRGHTATAISAVASMAEHALSCPIRVDATAADTAPVLDLALQSNWDLVLANKVPLAADRDDVQRLERNAQRRGRHILHEATVGAGLPVIDTLRKLIEAGDRVLSIEGCPSGTLGYLFGELGQGRSFASALRSAITLGYTEPDPRIDLSGIDVARKALILARIIGFDGDLSDVAIESLVPEPLRTIPREEFISRLEELDDAWGEHVQAARVHGKVLRYRARVTSRAVNVGLVSVATSDPLGALNGTDNQFAFTTNRYRQQPLVITGPGAGPAVTAAGVLNDLLRLAAERGVQRSKVARRHRIEVAAGSRPAATTP